MRTTPAVAVELHHRRLLEDPHAAREGDAAQATGEQGRLHGRRARLERRAKMDGRARAPLDLLGGQDLERPLARACCGFDGAFPGPELGRGRRRPEPAAAAVVRIDALPLAEGAQLVDRGDRRAHEPECLILARALDERLDLGPPGESKSTVSSRRPAAADVGLDERDRRAGLELGDAQCRPEARVAAADDAHVGADGLGELRGLDTVLGRECLLEPERPGSHGPQPR